MASYPILNILREVGGLEDGAHVVWSIRTSEYHLISFEVHPFLIVGSVLTARIETYQKLGDMICPTLNPDSPAMQDSGKPLRTAMNLLVKSPIESHVYIEWSLD